MYDAVPSKGREVFDPGGHSNAVNDIFEQVIVHGVSCSEKYIYLKNKR